MEEEKATTQSGSSAHKISSWDYLSLSEHRVVKQLIRTRSLVDKYYTSVRYGSGNVLETSGVFTFDEDILTTYFDLDALISECGLTELEMDIVTSMMDGYTVRDIVEERDYADGRAVLNRLDDAVVKIVSRNNQKWAESIEKAHHGRCQKIINKRKELKKRKLIY